MAYCVVNRGVILKIGTKEQLHYLATIQQLSAPSVYLS